MTEREHRKDRAVQECEVTYRRQEGDLGGAPVDSRDPWSGSSLLCRTVSA